jgi:hypothetical protein
MSPHTLTPNPRSRPGLSQLFNDAKFPPAQQRALSAAFTAFADELASRSAAPGEPTTESDLARALSLHLDVRLLELRLDIAKANSDMLTRLAGVVIVAMFIAIASARYMGLVN